MRKKTQNIYLQKLSQRISKLFHLISSIRIQLIIGFIIPIFFLLFTGYFSYSTASKGMIKNYEQSTQNAIQMALQYIDVGMLFTKNQALEIVANEDISTYSYGTYADDKIKQPMLYTQLYYELDKIAGSNPFIKDIHVITTDNMDLLTTSSTNTMKGFYQDFIEAADGQQLLRDGIIDTWSSSHPSIDERLSLLDDQYALFYAHSSSNKKACIIIDINNEIVQKTLTALELGDDTVLSFVTENGKEVTIPGTSPYNFASQKFYQSGRSSGEKSLSKYETINGKEYLYMYCKSDLSGAAICALVPKAKVMASANEIRFMTVLLIVLATLISGSIGFFILTGIIRNINRITKRLSMVSKGDLTVTFSNHSSNEFGVLSKEIMQTITNTKQVIENAQEVNAYVFNSTNGLMDTCMTLSKYSENISSAIEDIDQGISQQSGDSQQCLEKMDTLSSKIMSATEKLGNIEHLADTSKKLIKNGIESMDQLTVCSETTAQITHKVIDSTKQLEIKLNFIEQFVALIKDISRQTTLLSLNASIEAARAGVYGRGFSVVAQEIKKLADDSISAVENITNTVSEIKMQSSDTLNIALTAGSVVTQQEVALTSTLSALDSMNECLEKLLANIYQVGNSVSSMGADREGTLGAIESISSVSEETAASSCVVNETAREQLKYVEDLKNYSINLQQKTKELNEIIHQFKI